MSNPSLFSRASRRCFLAFALLLAGLSLNGASLAQSRVLDGPRSAGTVGERYDGYAVVRAKDGAAALAPLVDQVNADRRQVYAQRAATDHATIDQVGRIYATEIFKSAPAGTWFLQENGQWVQK
jgi:uncharacterized protein YdbL (DUF1318 family)